MLDYINNIEDLWQKCLKLKTLKSLNPSMDSACWVRKDPKCYGRYQFIGLSAVTYSLHVVSLTKKLERALSDDMVVDHLCLIKGCFNPDHLEEVTREENSKRGSTYGNYNNWLGTEDRSVILRGNRKQVIKPLRSHIRFS